jgi:cytoskeleton protein RodZ
VEITFDGNPYPLKAAKGAVKTLKFIGRKPDETAPAAPEPTAAPAAVPEKPVATPATPAAVAEPQAAATSGTPAGDKELEVFGQDGSWVILMPDTGPAKEVYVKKGQRLKVPFGQKIEVKLGNPSSVIFRHDGKETPVTTERGENKTVRFP